MMNFMIEKLINKKKMLMRFAQLFWEQRYKLLAVLAILIASVALKLTTPLAVGKIFDVISEGVIKPLYLGTMNFHFDFLKLGEIIALFFIKAIASSILIYIQKYMMSMVGKELVHALKKEARNKLSKISLKLCSARKKKEILKHIVLESEQISQLLQNNVIRSITSILTIVGTIIFMFQINWILATVFVLAIIVIIGTKVYQTVRNQQQSHRGMMLKFFQYVATGGLGLVFMIQGRLSFGQVQAFFQYMGKATTPFAETVFHSLKSVAASAERVSCLLDE